MMTKLVFPKSEDETEGAEIGGLIYLETVKREEEDSGCIPAALTGYVCPGLFTTPTAKGWMHFGGCPKTGAACFVIPAKKYKAWSAFLPKTVVSVDELNGKYYVWFLMDRHPAERCSACNDEVMLFWDGFVLVVPTRVHKWLPNPPETLATLTCAEAFRILGLPEPVAIPEILRPYMESDAEGKGVRLIPAHEGMPCIGMLSIPAVEFDTVKARFSDALKRAPVCRPETPANASPRVLFLCPDIPADITNRQIAHNGITAFFGGNTTPFKGEWNIPPEIKELPEVPFDDISDVVSGEGTQQEQENPSPKEEPPTVRRIEYPICFYDPAGIGGAASFAYDNAQKAPCDQSGRTQAPAAGLMPFDKINLAKIDNENMFLRVSLGGNINNRDGTQTNIPKPIPIVILDYDHILNPETGDYAEGIPDELRDEIEYLKQSTYCEFSKSGDGIHAYCIDNLPEPVTKGDKPFLKITADHKPEIFRGDSQVLCTGWRIPGACDDIQEIAISAIYTRQLGKSGVGNAVARAAALPAGPAIVANPPQEPDIDTARKYTGLIRSWERREEDVVSFLMRKDKIPYEASEAFQSITTRIAGDAAQEAANRNIPYNLIATPDRIEALWKLSDTYRTEYATGEHEYNSSKIELTVTKAISAGRTKYEKLMKRRAPAAAEFIDEEEAEPEVTPDDRATELEKQAQRMDEIAEKCGPVVKGMYQYYNTEVSLIYQPEIALFVALWAIGTICGRVWESERFKINTSHARIKIPATTTTDYLTILANTGTGKESIKKALRKFFEHLEIPTPSNATSASAIYTEMMLHPRFMLILDEAGRERRGAGSGKGDPFGPKAAETLLMSIYSNRTGDIEPSLYAPSRDNPHFQTIRRNAVSCVLISTPETYQDALQSDDAEGGYLSRHVMLHSTRPRDGEWKIPDDDDDDNDDNALLDPFREWLPYHAGMPELDTHGQLIRPDLAAVWKITNAYDQIKAARETAREMRTWQKNHYETNGPVIYEEGQPACIVKWDKKAKEEIASIYNANERDIKGHPEAAPLLTRKTEHIMKCAMVLALAKSTIGTPQETLTEPPADLDDPDVPDMNTATEFEVMHYETMQYAKCRSVYEIMRKATGDIDRSSAYYAIQEAPKQIAAIRKKQAALEEAIKQKDAATDDDTKNKIDEQIKGMVKKAGVKKDEENEQIIDDVEILREHYKEKLTKAAEEERKARTRYNAKNNAIETAVKRMYKQHAPIITPEYVKLAEEIIELAGKSSLKLMIDNIPTENWVKLKEEAVNLVKKAGSKGIPRSVLEKKINDRGRQQDKCATLIDQLLKEEVFMRGPTARNGGYKLYMRGQGPEGA